MRDPRPAEDGLPGSADPDRHRRLHPLHRRQHRRDPDPRSCHSTTAAPTNCWPAATPSGCSSSTAVPCGRSCGRWSRTTSRTSPRSWRSIVLAPWAPTPQRLRGPQERAAGRRRSTRSWPNRSPDPRRHPQRDRLPGTGHGDRTEGGRVLLGKADLLRRAMGRRRRSSTRSSSRSAPVCGPPGTPTSASTRCGTSSSRSPTTRSTRPTPPVTGWSRTGRRTLKANYPAEFMAALLTSVKDDKGHLQRPRSAVGVPQRVPSDGDQVLPRTSTNPTRLHAARQRHPVRVVGGPQRGRERRRLHPHHSPCPRPVRRLPGFPALRRDRCIATSGPSSR